MNCYEWRKKITGSVLVSVTVSEKTDSYDMTGGGTITHGPLYTGWTHRELQCFGTPQTSQPNWILRGDNLCAGRSQIGGTLTQENEITITITPKQGSPFSFNTSIYFRFADPSTPETQSLLPLNPYPNWENDPYSVAERNYIDNLQFDYLFLGVGGIGGGSPNPYEVPFKWLKSGLTSQSPNNVVSASLTVSFSLT